MSAATSTSRTKASASDGDRIMGLYGSAGRYRGDCAPASETRRLCPASPATLYRTRMPATAPARLVLASASPRRRELLGAVGLGFDLAPADLDEEALGAGLAPKASALVVAAAKAAAPAGGGRGGVGADPPAGPGPQWWSSAARGAASPDPTTKRGACSRRWAAATTRLSPPSSYVPQGSSGAPRATAPCVCVTTPRRRSPPTSREAVVGTRRAP